MAIDKIDQDELDHSEKFLNMKWTVSWTIFFWDAQISLFGRVWDSLRNSGRIDDIDNWRGLVYVQWGSKVFISSSS